VGDRPTEAVEAILKVTGDWLRYKGEAGEHGHHADEGTEHTQRLVDRAAAPGPKRGRSAHDAMLGREGGERPGTARLESGRSGLAQ